MLAAISWPWTAVSAAVRFTRIFTGVLWRRGVRRQWSDRKRQFFSSFVIPLEQLKDQQYYVIISILSCDFHWLQNVWPRMTLSGHFYVKLGFRAGMSILSSLLSETTAWKHKNIVHCRRQKCSAGTLVSGSVWFMRIFDGYSGKEASNDTGCFSPTRHMRRLPTNICWKMLSVTYFTVNNNTVLMKSVVQYAEYSIDVTVYISVNTCESVLR